MKGARPNFSKFVLLSLNSRPRYQIVVDMGNVGKIVGYYDGKVKKLAPLASLKRCAKKNESEGVRRGGGGGKCLVSISVFGYALN